MEQNASSNIEKCLEGQFHVNLLLSSFHSRIPHFALLLILIFLLWIFNERKAISSWSVFSLEFGGLHTRQANSIELSSNQQQKKNKMIYYKWWIKKYTLMQMLFYIHNQIAFIWKINTRHKAREKKGDHKMGWSHARNY